jgi:hypothetical protein
MYGVQFDSSRASFEKKAQHNNNYKYTLREQYGKQKLTVHNDLHSEIYLR